MALRLGACQAGLAKAGSLPLLAGLLEDPYSAVRTLLNEV